MTEETFANRVRRSIDQSRNPATGRPYTVPQIVQALGGQASTAWVYAIRDGEYQDTSAYKLKALADVLGVSVDWLLSGDTPDATNNLQRPEVQNLALRGGQMSPEVLKQVTEIMDILERDPGRTGGGDA